MGICKCRKRTDLFCFVHKKAVCETCISTDHQVCVVKSYFDWLSEPEYEQPSCGICKGELNPDNMVRFLCLDMFHPECIDVYASSLPANTALAGYTCPTCDKPILPTPGNTSVLAQQIRTTFANSSWAARILGSADDGNIDLSSPEKQNNYEEKHTSDASPTNSSSPHSSESYNHNSDLHTKDDSNKDPLDPLSYHPPPQSSYPASTAITIDQPSPSVYGMTSHRKATKPLVGSTGAPYPLDDEDEDKYRKKGLMQLFSALGLVSSASLDAKRGRLDPKILTLLFAGVATIIIFVFLYYVVFSDVDPITIEEELVEE